MDISPLSSSGYSRPLTLRLIGPHAPSEMPVLFSYDPRDPFAVRITFGGAGREEDRVTWLVDRELLRAGLDLPIGDGDVRVGPTAEGTDILFLHLRSPSGEALMELSRTALAAFIGGTETLLPFGAEVAALDLDGELALLLSDGNADPTIR